MQSALSVLGTVHRFYPSSQIYSKTLILYTIKGLMCKTSDKWSAPKTRQKSKNAVQYKVTQINS